MYARGTLLQGSFPPQEEQVQVQEQEQEEGWRRIPRWLLVAVAAAERLLHLQTERRVLRRDPYPDSDHNSNSHSNPNSNSHSNPNSNLDADADRDADRDSHFDPYSYSDARSPLRGRGARERRAG